ncbi:MAG: type III effector HrpK [Ewingella americana]|jgi:hypothetical protein|uniref:type III effector HrpK domain-containing protein n=1 Tax=Ewingella americana TaxID=41202 RepID=UPI00242E2AC7|nr:type III effector HrpK domain-containing protein [Ewingella americana]MCI1852515.1 type III effector HrpK [Ewingella americana]MCI1863878.1 type III effector HrpK [Ewingella americana]MCI2166397.1 type III effector HrpK [Ewingella americana]MCI2211843.1 type III effector HrpK [Ewingella americana]
MRVLPSQSGPAFNGSISSSADETSFGTQPPASTLNRANSGSNLSIQYGQTNNQANNAAANDPGDIINELASMIAGLLRKMSDAQSGAASGTPPAPTGTATPANSGVSTPQSTSPTSATSATSATSTTSSSSATSSASSSASSADADFIDNSKYSSPEELKKYAPLVANLPPDQQLQAEKEMNRPAAAAKMAAAGGPDAAHAKAFIDANPALKTATDVGKHGGKPDGKTTNGDYAAFANNMDKARDAAVKDVTDYQKAHPNADPQSLQMVTSAATLRASEPLVKCASLDSNGKVDSYITADSLKAIQQNNPGLSPALQQSAKTFSQPGFLYMLDQGGLEGKDLALHNPDQKISGSNIDNWIAKQAPTNSGEFASMMNDAATRNAVANVDISNLGADVFQNPQNYSGAQKAAVLVKLQQTQGQVDGGSSLRKTDKTSQALQDDIAQLQSDPDVQKFMAQAVPGQEKMMIGNDPGLSKAVNQSYQDLISGKTMDQDMQAARDSAAKANAGKKPEDQQPVDYSDAINSLNSELQLQGDLQGKGANLPTTAQVINSRPDLKQQIQTSYDQNFTQGQAVESGLKNNSKADAKDVLADVDQKKAAYEDAIPDSVTAASEDGYAEATMKALSTTSKGMSFLNTLKDAGTLPKDSDLTKMSGKEMYSQLREGVEKQTSEMGLSMAKRASLSGNGIMSVAGLATVSEQLKSGDKAGAAKTIYDGIKGSSELGKLGFNTAAEALGKDASVGLGRIAGSVAGRVVGTVAGEAAGAAAAEALGAAAGPVGWIVDAAMGLGFGIKAIIDAVKKHKDQKTFDHNVDPTLKQFGIPTPS